MQSKSALLHKAFVFTVLLNGIVGTLDIAIGIFFAFQVSATSFAALYTHTFIGTFFTWAIALIGTHSQMGAFYFFSHGAVKLFLVWGLYRKKLWAYPFAIAFLSGFSVYQAFTLIASYSGFVFTLLLINIVVIILIGHEYMAIRAILRMPEEPSDL